MRAPRLAWLFVTCLLGGLPAACGSAETTTDNVPEPTCPKLVEDTLLEAVAPPDGASLCASGDCNYQTQDGCAEDQACRPQFNATDPDVHPGCEPAGSAKSGEACKTQADCARGTYCGAGACHKLCCGADWTGCDRGESCLRSLDVRAGGKLIPADAWLCFPVNDCDIFDPKSCADDPSRECKIVDPTGAVACALKSNADVGDACAPPTVCKQGLSCVGGFCSKLCAYAACAEPACSEADGTCVHFVRDPEGVGECTLDR